MDPNARVIHRAALTATLRADAFTGLGNRLAIGTDFISLAPPEPTKRHRQGRLPAHQKAPHVA